MIKDWWEREDQYFTGTSPLIGSLFSIGHTKHIYTPTTLNAFSILCVWKRERETERDSQGDRDDRDRRKREKENLGRDRNGKDTGKMQAGRKIM